MVAQDQARRLTIKALAHRSGWWLAGLAAVSVVLYLLRSSTTHSLGYPLDDAWIHQTYARNWAQGAGWAFLPGRPSAGSTAPLWTAVLAVGYALRVPHPLWTYLSGGVILLALGWVCARWFRARNPDAGSWSLMVGALILTEWHLVWSSVSGMETGLYALLAVAVMWISAAGAERRRWVGFLVGCALWVRPDAALLSLPVVWQIALDGEVSVRRRLLDLGWFAVGLALALLPYLLLNFQLSGEAWPTTFYAKSSEYALLRELPLLTRILTQLGIPGAWLGQPGLEPGGPLVGPLMVLLPGLALSLRRSIRARDFAALAPALWLVAHLCAYALRLPATYQHGRYAIPIIPAMVVLGVEGLLSWIRFPEARLVRRVVSRAWLLIIGVLAVSFWFVGASAYARDVAIIETEMVAAARWIAAKTEAQALVAAHDIGALGYFGDRELIDLAGLISPEVIDFIRDERALAEYLDQRQADYLMTFPGWYPALSRELDPLYTSDGSFSRAAGGENMVVYRWQPPRFAP